MWTLLVLCSVIALDGVQGADRFLTTEEMHPTTHGVPVDATIAERITASAVAGAHCGGQFFGRRGVFNSPNYPNAYPHFADCIWYITPGSRIVQLAFPFLNIEFHQTCAFDAISVYDGSSTSSRLLGKVCGTDNTTFYSTGTSLTVRFRSDNINSFSGFRAEYQVVDSCRYKCGYQMENCSCSSSCGYRGNCCPDYEDYCSVTAAPVTAQRSCRYNCGVHLGGCSCTSSCRYQGNCCHDYNYVCLTSTQTPSVTARPSCLYNCGRNMGSCSCSSSCQYYGNCCYDYHYMCLATTIRPVASTADWYSYRNKCGSFLGSCHTCRPSCRYNCGWNLGSCSCSSSCPYYGNCCYDFYSYCQVTTDTPTITDTPSTVRPCGGSLFGSGNFSSPDHPNYYDNNTYCVWQLRAGYDERIFLAFTYLQLQNCCSCDYIAVYDGLSVSSGYLGKVCNNNNNSLSTFSSTSNYMTVVFRTDSSGVGRGFSADFISSLPPSSGRVECSSDNMTVVIQRNYLRSLGYDGYSLYLNDPHCRPEISYYQVVFNFSINSCGNVRKVEDGRVVYTNALRAYTSSYGEITRQSHLKMSVGCWMEQDSVAEIMYIVRHHNSSIIGTGKFNPSMDIYTSSSFYNKVTQVPYVVTLNQNLYVQVDLRSGDRSLVLFLDTCVTSPSPHDFQTRPYYLVRNGCNADNTYYAYVTGTRSYARFTFKTFQFLRATESVYIQCKVLICQASDYNSRCRRGCSKRAARDLGSQHDSQTLVLGPIQLKDPEKKEEETQNKE